MKSIRELDFESKMNTLRMQALERKAVETDPWSEDFEQIMAELKSLEQRQTELSIERHLSAIESIKTMYDGSDT